MRAVGRTGLAVVAGTLLWFGAGALAEAERPIRIGASTSRTGAYAALGQNQMYGATVGVGQPEFYRRLERAAEFVYGPRSGSRSSSRSGPAA